VDVIVEVSPEEISASGRFAPRRTRKLPKK
jgi:hypothetical protein